MCAGLEAGFGPQARERSVELDEQLSGPWAESTLLILLTTFAALAGGKLLVRGMPITG